MIVLVSFSMFSLNFLKLLWKTGKCRWFRYWTYQIRSCTSKRRTKQNSYLYSTPPSLMSFETHWIRSKLETWRRTTFIRWSRSFSWRKTSSSHPSETRSITSLPSFKMDRKSKSPAASLCPWTFRISSTTPKSTPRSFVKTFQSSTLGN